MKNPLSFQNVLLGGSILFFSTFLVLIFGLSSSRAQHDGTEETLALTPLAATSRYPGCDTDDITVGDYTIAACNVGATTAGTTSASYGSLFQRGNNYGFPSSGSITTNSSQINASNFGPDNPYSSSIFRTASSWDSSNNFNLRGGSGDTTSTEGPGTDEERKGPCEEGYHVPSAVEWSEVLGELGGYSGTQLSNALLIPFVGFRSYSNNGSLDNQGISGPYWSSSPVSYGRYYMNITSYAYYVNYNFYPSQGFAVRCFKNATVDTEAPVITLLGSETVLLLLGETYIESGASRTDNVDGNGTLSTPTSGSVDVNQIGTYLLEYTYTDQAGNTGNTVTRTVKVLDANAFYPGCDTPNLIVGDSTIAACNVGATTAYDGSNCTNSNCPQSVAGYVFQRGNNYGFTGTTKQGSTASEVGITTGASAIAWTASNSLWITTNPRYTDGNTTSLRGNSNNPQGPCSKGRHVPTAAEWQEVFAILGTGQNSSFLVSNALKLPPAGLRSYNTAAAYNVKYTGRYWSSTPSAAVPVNRDWGNLAQNPSSTPSDAYNVNFDKDKIELVNNYRSYGFSVRCFKNAPDTEAPIVTLLGSETVLLLLGEAYIESGASWTDNLDGTGELLTATSGSVDTGTLGTYLLEYTYTDQAGNTGNTVTRTVQVLQSDLPTTSPESGGGGGGSILKKDDCPDGDFSPSYYDRICNEMTESSEQSGTSGRTSPTPPSEGGQRDAQSEGEQQDTQSEGGWGDAQSLYQWAFQRGITTMPTLEEARMNDTITRAEMAKILVVATFPSTTSLTKEESSALSLTTSLTKGGRSEATGGSHTTEQTLQKEGCQSFSDLKQVNVELQSFIIQVCQLGLMGYYADGQTLKPAFSPNATITVAEVATILSRILRGETYKGSEQWRYHNHLLALQKAGIIPRAIDPMSRELRGNIFTMLFLLNTYDLHFIL